jgi:16S rRNA (guanine(527)-N(7))-methyltransferase RsmG
MVQANAFYQHLLNKNTNLSQEKLLNAAKFAEILHRENEKQNLTRITGVAEFYDGHLVDCIELLKQPALSSRILDIGSGCGVPGLLSAAIDLNSTREYFLVDSEQMKANFLSETAAEIGLKQVSVISDRVEKVISDISPDTVIARAVGKVDKIANWIWECSTWNNLILFKSKGWEEEWREAKTSRFGKKLTITHFHEYSSGEKYRALITLKRK